MKKLKNVFWLAAIVASAVVVGCEKDDEGEESSTRPTYKVLAAYVGGVDVLNSATYTTYTSSSPATTYHMTNGTATVTLSKNGAQSEELYKNNGIPFSGMTFNIAYGKDVVSVFAVIDSTSTNGNIYQSTGLASDWSMKRDDEKIGSGRLDANLVHCAIFYSKNQSTTTISPIDVKYNWLFTVTERVDAKDGKSYAGPGKNNDGGIPRIGRFTFTKNHLTEQEAEAEVKRQAAKTYDSYASGWHITDLVHEVTFSTTVTITCVKQKLYVKQ